MAEPRRQGGSDSPKKTETFREFGGMDTRSGRNALGNNQFSRLENLQPIGFGNLSTVPQPIYSTQTNIVGVGNVDQTIYRAQYVRAGGMDYVIQFLKSGTVIATLVSTTPQTGTVIGNIGAYVNGSLGARVTSWQGATALFISLSGYYTWDGNLAHQITLSPTTTVLDLNTIVGTFVVGETIHNNGTPNVTGTVISFDPVLMEMIVGSVSGVGFANLDQIRGNTSNASANITTAQINPTPAQGQDVVVYAGRVWVAYGATVTFSAPNSYTDFSTNNTGGSFTINDTTLRGGIKRLFTANGYLYIFGASSVDIVSDVSVSTTSATVGAAPIAIFNRTNINAIIGTTQPDSVCLYNRTVCFANQYGFWSLNGVSFEKMSTDIDITISQIDFNFPVSAGIAVINNILTICFLFRWKDPEFLGSERDILACYFDNKWWLSSQYSFVNSGLTKNYSSQSQALSIYLNDVPSLMLVGIEPTLSQVLSIAFQDTTIDAAIRLETPLWSFGAGTMGKQVTKVGLEVSSDLGFPSFFASVDSERGGAGMVQISPSGIQILSGVNVIPLIGSSGMAIPLLNPGYGIGYRDFTQHGKYVGITMVTNGRNFTVSAISLEYQFRERY